MGLEKHDKLTYLRISDGKIRMKTTKEDPEAEERHDDINNKFLYERVYSSCEGYIRDIQQQVHDEYGTSYNIIIFDPGQGERYSINIAEASRYFQSFVMCLPNIDFAQPIKIKPYSFKKDGRQNIGISFEQNGQKITNFYKKYNPKTEESTPINGLEDFDFSTCEDKHDTKIMQTKLLKFLVSELKREVKRLLAFVESSSDSSLQNVVTEDDDMSEEKSVVKEEKSSKTAKKKQPEPAKKSRRKKSSDDDLPY